jgi:hypothetical protein
VQQQQPRVMLPPHAPWSSLSGVAAALALERGPQIGKARSGSESLAAAQGDTKAADRVSAASTHDEYRALYGDGKVANRENRVWHGATEKGP